VLSDARRGNEFLQGVPDDQLTHHVEAVIFPVDTVTLCYHFTDLDVGQGTWSMTGVFFAIPSTGSLRAYRHARARTPAGSLPMSAKRTRYGLRAAESEADLREEQVLVDTSSHAAAMIGAHPDLMSLEPGSAHVVHSGYIDTDINTVLLGIQLQSSTYGPAMPAPANGGKNATGWGTLVAATGDDGKPLVNTAGRNRGRIQYQPVFHPDIAAAAGSAAAGVVPAVKDDATLGMDVTGRKPAGGAAAAGADPDPSVAGALWFRHDGVTHRSASSAPAGAAAASTVGMALKNGTPGDWLWPSASTSVNGDGSVQVSLDLLNWGLRFLGVYVQFLSTKTSPPTVLLLKDIPEYRDGTVVGGHTKDMDTDQEMFLGMLGPVFTILGIPTAPGYLLPSFRLPANVDQVRVLSGGLAFSGANTYPQTVLAGAIMTGIFNYGVTSFMAAAGAGGTFSLVMKEAVVPVARVLAPELIAFISAELKKTGQDLVDLLLSAAFWESQLVLIAKLLTTKAAGAAVEKLVAVLTADLTEAVLEDSIPLAGWIMLGVSIGVGVLNLAETSAELALSPWTFVDDLTFTHDLNVTLRPDPQNGNFPQQADRYTVTALFDDGTPHVQTLAMPPGTTSSLPVVTFSQVPLGGQVNVSVAFHRAGTATSVDVLLGKGTTGLVPNSVAAPVPPLPIQELKFPIDASTVYRHQRKTSIGAGGGHAWTAGAAPTANLGNSSCGGPGTVCEWNGITVRQATSAPPRRGYVGYSWRGQSTDPSKGAACIGGGTGQLDAIANLDTTDASLGYTTSTCGLQPGALVAYNLLSHGSANFFLDADDPDAPMIRQVTLEPTPVIDATSRVAWGVLNLKSDALLLHPSGHVISLSSVDHKIETHRLPSAPLADADARGKLRAQLSGGQGTRPGLLTSPQHAAVAPDGTLIVLEAGDVAQGTPSRLQAFNLSINPVRFFAQQAQPYFLMLTETPNNQGWIYLDLAVEFTGFIYVLSYHSVTFEYRLDIYHPTQSGTRPISSTS
jgi:hypothetical protein